MSFLDTAQQRADQKAERWFLVALALISAWLLTCAFLIEGEFGDGYATIVNARYFFGDSPGYYVQRGPLAAVVLWPVELIVQALNLNALDVRPYHVFSALLHSAYLYICWMLLRRAPGSGSARLLAFATAILTVVFYCYAPYLSHDLLPGMMFLVMIFIAHRWLEQPRLADSIYLVLLGAAVTLTKQTYAIFWVTIVAFAFVSLLLKADNGRVTVRKWLILTSLAACSAVITWLGYSWFIAAQLPDESILMRPIRLAVGVSEMYKESLAEIFPANLYLLNLPNYGIAAVLMVIPGLVLAFRGSDARMRMIATCWLLSVTVIQITGFREIRYLAFLAPLTAMLIVPVAYYLLHHKNVTALLLIGLVLFDQARSLTVAAEQITTAPSSNVTRFINAPDGTGNIYASRVLSFLFDPTSPLQGDRYHGIYHLTPILLHTLQEGRTPVAIIENQAELGMVGMQPGDVAYIANFDVVRRPPWQPNNVPVQLEDYVLVAGNVTTVELQSSNGAFEAVDNDGRYLMFIPAPEVGEQEPFISDGALPAETARRLYGELAENEPLEVTVVVIRALCQAGACSYARVDQ